MKHVLFFFFCMLIAIGLGCTPKNTRDYDAPADAEPKEDVNAYLARGAYEKGVRDCKGHLAANPSDDNVRFELAFMRFLQGIEHIVSSFYLYGVNTHSPVMRDARLPLPDNPKPKAMTYAILRKGIEDTRACFIDACETLGEIQSEDVKMRVYFGRVKLDINGDGYCRRDETLWRVYNNFEMGEEATDDEGNAFVISFDKGDVHWLKGYSHLLIALHEFALSYDFEMFINSVGHLFFANMDTPYTITLGAQKLDRFIDSEIIDIISAVHLANFPVRDKDGLRRTREHLLSVIDESRKSWAAIRKETDNENEWLPNPKQTGVIPGVSVTDKQIDSWLAVLDEGERVLEGKKLVPFWRLPEGYGINVKTFFLSPAPFDVVSMVQGPGLHPFIEKGDISSEGDWERLMREFGGNFIGFAFWFN